jgi:hypothetical protein
MTADAIYQEQDQYAEEVSAALSAQGIVSDEEAAELKRFLRGW